MVKHVELVNAPHAADLLMALAKADLPGERFAIYWGCDEDTAGYSGNLVDEAGRRYWFWLNPDGTLEIGVDEDEIGEGDEEYREALEALR
jgi:hypothetical protein